MNDWFAMALAYPARTVVRDDSGCVWVKKWLTWQRPGSTGDYGTEAIVRPWVVLWQPAPYKEE